VSLREALKFRAICGSNNSILDGLTFSMLNTVTGQIIIGSHGVLMSVSLPSLTTAANINVSGNLALDSFGLPSLASTTGGIQIDDNPALSAGA
jgi:hypothetical protein